MENKLRNHLYPDDLFFRQDEKHRQEEGGFIGSFGSVSLFSLDKRIFLMCEVWVSDQNDFHFVPQKYAVSMVSADSSFRQLEVYACRIRLNLYLQFFYGNSLLPYPINHQYVL